MLRVSKVYLNYDRWWVLYSPISVAFFFLWFLFTQFLSIGNPSFLSKTEWRTWIWNRYFPSHPYVPFNPPSRSESSDLIFSSQSNVMRSSHISRAKEFPRPDRKFKPIWVAMMWFLRVQILRHCPGALCHFLERYLLQIQIANFYCINTSKYNSNTLTRFGFLQIANEALRITTR